MIVYVIRTQMQGLYIWTSGISGMKCCNGVVEWNGGMEWWNGITKQGSLNTSRVSRVGKNSRSGDQLRNYGSNTGAYVGDLNKAKFTIVLKQNIYDTAVS